MPLVRRSSWLTVAIVAAQALLLSLLPSAGVTGPTPPPAHPSRAVLFELNNADAVGALDPGKPVELSVYLTGASPRQDSIVAIFEGDPFVRRLVPMTHRSEQNGLHTAVTLEPYSTGLVSPQEKAFRVKVTFAHVRGMRLIEILTRSVYLTLDVPPTAEQLNTTPFSQAEQYAPRDFSLGVMKILGPRAHLKEEQITEQDLIPSPLPPPRAYWQQISQLIGMSWTGAISSTHPETHKGTVAVGFRLFANGDAQLIHVERSSGVRELDEAAMQAIVGAHPFPPFPSDLPSDAVDMHVELGRFAPTVTHAGRSLSSTANR